MNAQGLEMVEKEKQILLTELCQYLPGQPSYWTLLRWSSKGTTSQRGKVVYLNTVKLPGGKGSSIALYERFIQELND